ncbi:histidine kinase [Aquincola sp. S2]|uniref:Histidine kinase n=2 Tax=Pseudaquabacterium terrae TaxID=2732868 RepID=A0ABX2ET20_9BURK|nr:histidine kinase [Aquabacterium terrae]
MQSATSTTTPAPIWIARVMIVGLLGMLAFGFFEQWPQKVPRRLSRWGLQLLGLLVAVPIGALVAYWVTTGEWQFWHDRLRLTGFMNLIFMGILFGPWIALAAMVRQREALAHQQALAFQLERSEFERQALDARMRLMQAQVQPHFLFNTLANVRALVRTGSPQAPAVLDALIAYLRAAVPRLDETASTLEQELQLVRAYLELMHMRMPDRLQFAIHADEAANPLRCSPMTLLTLVENAVRHGIDPGEEGGRIEVSVSLREGRCIVRVTDTGVGLQPTGAGLGTGLSTLRERMQLAFGGDARLSLTGLVPHGVCAELEFPAQRVPRDTA